MPFYCFSFCTILIQSCRGAIIFHINWSKFDARAGFMKAVVFTKRSIILCLNRNFILFKFHYYKFLHFLYRFRIKPKNLKQSHFFLLCYMEAWIVLPPPLIKPDKTLELLCNPLKNAGTVMQHAQSVNALCQEWA